MVAAPMRETYRLPMPARAKSTNPKIIPPARRRKPPGEDTPDAASPGEMIRLRGIRQNNLKGFNLDLPLGKFIVVTGPSGSGKSSLAF